MPLVLFALLAWIGPANLTHTPQATRIAEDSSRLVWRLTDPDLLPEDIVFDAARNRYLITSIRCGGVYAVDDRGQMTTVVAPSERMWGTFALGIDVRSGTLWVTTAAIPGTARYTAADSARSALLAFDLATGAFRQRLVPPDSGGHVLGDLTVAPDGAVYVADSFGGGVYVLDAGANALRILVPPHTFRSPQTPALSADGRLLFIPDYSNGIASVDVSTGARRWLDRPDTLSLRGIDGLYRVGDALIAMQNGPTPNRILRLTLSGGLQITRAELMGSGGGVTDINHALPSERGLEFLARTGWDRMGGDGRFTPATAGDAPELRRIPLRR